MRNTEFHITEIREEDKLMISKFITERWESSMSVSRGKSYDTSALPGFISRNQNEIIGLITYIIESDDCEIVTLDSNFRNKGLGTKLINSVINIAVQFSCKRVWLITTNDNVNAIRFYQKRGFNLAAFHKDSIKESRKLKPEIPEIGFEDIPIKHEIEFEMTLK